MSRSIEICKLFVCLVTLVGVSQVSVADGLDPQLRQLLAESAVGPLPPATSVDQNVVDLGRSLFFDRELSGNRDISCASCHHPSLASGDSRALPSGTGGEGLGPDRTQAAGREIVPRNSPEVFHRGHPEWRSMFWDSRVSKQNGTFTSPAGPDLPPDLDNVLAVQAMFPVTSREEMRGRSGDLDIQGRLNELAIIDDGELPAIWQAIMNRLLSIPEYQQKFAQAFPDVPAEALAFQHAANAIAAFEESAFSQRDSAWDSYLAGDDSAISESAKRGAIHFYGGNCASCHSGNLMTDQQHHNLGIPQLGPGKDPDTGLDPGRALETGEQADQFAFRTPPLRNVLLTGPWAHSGAFTRLVDVIRHKFAPVASLDNYDVSQLSELLQPTVRLDADAIAAITRSLDPLLPIGEEITDEEVGELMAFLFSLTSPSADRMLHLTPSSVPSGLDVDSLPPSDMRVTYDPEDGQLQLTSAEELLLDGLFLRISNDEAGTPAAFEFQLGSAPWSDHHDIVLSDDVAAQSFIEYRSESRFLLVSGDRLESLLPAGLPDASVERHLSAAYRVRGSPVLWTADVVTVSEPTSSILLLVLGLFALVCLRGRGLSHRGNV